LYRAGVALRKGFSVIPGLGLAQLPESFQGKGYTKNRKGKAIQRSNGKTYIPNTTVWTVEGEKLIHEQLKKLGITPRIETRAVAEQQDFGGWED
jgi:hypothetical protein